MKIDQIKINGLLWGVWIGWTILLIGYVLYWSVAVLGTAAVLLLLFLLRLVSINKGIEMFKKKHKDVIDDTTPATVLAENSQLATEGETSSVPQSARRCTVVAENALFTGDMTLAGDIHVYGKMVGNISLTDGILHVMREGVIDGDFTAPMFIINGHAKGTCTGEKVEILEHGEIEGVCRSDQLSIRPGGRFIGTSERLSVEVKREPDPERVVKIKKGSQEKPAEPSSVVALALSE